MGRKFASLLVGILLLPCLVVGQELHTEEQGVWRARVIRVLTATQEYIPGTETQANSQRLLVEITGGDRRGEYVEFTNDFAQLKTGDRFFLVHTKTVDGGERYAVQEVDRTIPLTVLALLFVAAVLALSGFQGVRSLIALLGSFCAVVFVLLPLLLAGYPPILTSICVAVGILTLAIFLTHGINTRSLVALVGTSGAVILTGVLSFIFVTVMRLTGLSSDEAIYLNFSMDGSLDVVGLLLGGFVIGILGVLDDIAITQAAVVRELYEHDPELRPRTLYQKALRVGKEHVGALVNTLVLAYTGAALPLLLLFFNTEASFLTVVNQEVVTTEIIRTLVGSIGLVATVPLTTALAVAFRKKIAPSDGALHTHKHEG